MKIPEIMTRAQFIELSKKQFGDKFSYMRVNMSTLTPNTKIVLSCDLHGDFTTTVVSHLNSKEHGNCAKCRNTKKKRAYKRYHDRVLRNFQKVEIDSGIDFDKKLY